MRGEKVGGSVGFRIGAERKDSPRSDVVFVTVGYLVAFLSHNMDKIKTFTHIVLDEVGDCALVYCALLGCVAVVVAQHGQDQDVHKSCSAVLVDVGAPVHVNFCGLLGCVVVALCPQGAWF